MSAVEGLSTATSCFTKAHSCLAMIIITDYYQCAIMRMIVERSPHKNKIDSLWLSKSFQRVGVKDQIKCDLSLSLIYTTGQKF
jgi:hypothetical protein